MIQENRVTRETDIDLSLNIRGSQKLDIRTGLAFFDHMLEQLAFRAGWDLTLTASQTSEIDDHHVIEDVALVLGNALFRATAQNPKIQRFASITLPMDDALVLCAIDLGGRPFCQTELKLTRESIGPVATENIVHFFFSLAMAGRFNLHISRLAGFNTHHIIEASFKALGLALGEALTESTLKASTKEASP